MFSEIGLCCGKLLGFLAVQTAQLVLLTYIVLGPLQWGQQLTQWCSMGSVAILGCSVLIVNIYAMGSCCSFCRFEATRRSIQESRKMGPVKRALLLSLVDEANVEQERHLHHEPRSPGHHHEETSSFLEPSPTEVQMARSEVIQPTGDPLQPTLSTSTLTTSLGSSSGGINMMETTTVYLEPEPTCSVHTVQAKMSP